MNCLHSDGHGSHASIKPNDILGPLFYGRPIGVLPNVSCPLPLSHPFPLPSFSITSPLSRSLSPFLSLALLTLPFSLSFLFLFDPLTLPFPSYFPFPFSPHSNIFLLPVSISPSAPPFAVFSFPSLPPSLSSCKGSRGHEGSISDRSSGERECYLQSSC